VDKSSQPAFWNHLHDALEERKKLNLFREVSISEYKSRTRVIRNGVEAIHFGSNDYLGLAWHPALREAALGQSQYGSGASPAVSGYQAAHAQMCQALCAFEQTESAVVFSSGYAANVGTVSALATKEDVLFSDSLNHASLIDGCRLSRAKVCIYPHGDMDALRGMIRQERGAGRFGFIVSDSVFSMDGDLAPVQAIHRLCQEYDLQCILDEAHATGVYGPCGRGLLEHERLESDRFVHIGTLSKAVACVGGFVTGRKVLIDWLSNHARSWLYSTSTTVSNALSVCAAISLVQSMQPQRLRLSEASRRIRSELSSAGYSTGQGDSPIIPVYMRSPSETLDSSRRLLSQGVFVPAIRPPTVPPNGCLLRISLSAAHSDDDLKTLMEAIRAL
jgi:8-amino-7-oxononanoate synthase